MKKLIILAISAVAFTTLARADGIKDDDDIGSPVWLKPHHSGLHIKFKKSQGDQDTGVDLDDFIWQSNSDQSARVSSTGWSAPESTSEENIGQDDNGGDPSPAAVPEPGTLVLLGTGMLIGAAAVRKQIKSSAVSTRT